MFSKTRLTSPGSARRAAGVLACGLLGFAMSAVPALFIAKPVPHVHDEFSYLLAADTFAHGRLTNPTHPMWEHFETMHVLWKPTYMSRYPPGQGFLLALGQLTGDPVIGVWLSFGLFGAALCWMLQAFVPARWAVLTTLLALLRIGFEPDAMSITQFGYWAQSYWGGAVAGAAGALCLGGLGRLRRGPALAPALAVAAGIAGMGLTRPYEGLLVALPALGFVALRARRGGAWMPRVLLPIGACLAAFLAFVAVDNRAVTGSALRLPYREYQLQYTVWPSFLVQKPLPEPVYRNRELRKFFVEWEPWYAKEFHRAGAIENYVRDKIYQTGSFFYGPPLAVFLLLLPCVVRMRSMRLPLILIGASLAGWAFETWFLWHYAAPVAGLLYLIVAQALRHVRLLGGRRVGRALVAVGVAVSAVFAALPVVRAARYRPRYWAEDRAAIEERLTKEGGNHLVLVHYGESHTVLNEWVYNRALLDEAPVIWARELGAEKDARLLSYFADRRAWHLLIERDELPPQLTPLAPE